MIGGEFFSTVFMNPDMLVENGVAKKWASLVSDALNRAIVITYRPFRVIQSCSVEI